MGTCEELMALAQEQVGKTSGEEYWEWYRETYAPWLPHYVNGALTPYCAIFDSCMLAWTGTSCPWFPNTYAFDLTEDLGGRGVGKYDLQRGDMVTFDWGIDGLGDHVGIVVSVHDWGICTIEGNTSGGVVAEQQRLWSVIICGVRPYYDEEDDDMTEEQMRSLLEQFSDETADKSAQRSAEYVYGDEDKGRDLNMYNAAHWAYNIGLENRTRLDRVEAKMDAIMRHLRIEQ